MSLLHGKRKMFKDGNTGGDKTNSTSHQEYLFGDTLFYSIDVYIRITGVIHHYKSFLNNFREEKKKIGIFST